MDEQDTKSTGAIERHLRAIFQQAAVGMAVAGLDGRFEEVNRRICQILGCEPEELAGRTFRDITHPSDLAKTDENVRRLVAGEISDFAVEKRYIRKDGRTIWSLTTVTLLKSPDGAPERFIGVIEDITERKRYEEVLRENNERLQLALAAGHLGDWSWDIESDIVSLGPEACGVFGLPPGAIITWQKLRDRLHPEDRERANLAVAEALKSRKDYDIEYRVTREDGLAWVAARGRGLYSGEGKVRGMIGVVLDVTERRETEAIRSRLAAVVEGTDDAIISLGLDTVVTTWNKSAERVFGYTAEEAIGKSITFLIPPELSDEEPRIIQRLLRGERVEHYETVRIRKDGARLNVSLTVSAVHDASGKIVGISKISRDITALKKHQEALREETRILELLNTSGRAIASQLDLQSLLQTVTDSATQLTGARFGAFFYNGVNEEGAAFMLYTLSGAPREAFDKFGHPRATPMFAPTFKGEGPIRIADVTQDPRYGKWGPHHGMPKGHLPVRSYLAVPVVSRNGEVIGGLFFGHPDAGVFTERSERLIVGMAAQAAIAIDNARLYDAAQREIAQRKKVEEALREAQGELRRHAENLEEQVAERTAKLRETIQELEAFSYSVSHDMRSPLRAMQGYSDALIEDHKDKLDPTAQDYLTRIRRAAGRMDLLIQDVLAYSRVAKGDIQLHEVDVENVIRDVLQNYPALHAERADVKILSPLPRVLGHEAYLTQIVSNLLSNAIKFVPADRRPSVTIGSERHDDAVTLFFQDNGIGIAPEHHSRIFQIFGRVYSDKKFEGTGIGLAIVKKAAERMGGIVALQSELGKGSRFSVTLRLADG